MNTTYLVPFFLGTFSGFLATLPIGPAKILAVRKFLLITKGNENEVSDLRSSNTILLASISGLIFAQLLFFLALQYPFLYSLWVKPHFFSFFFVSILFFYLYQIKNIHFDIYNTQPILKNELNFSYQKAAFLETFLFQLLNPVVLPNPVFCRLTNVFLFRYSTISTFFVGNVLGLLGGYGTFFFSTLFLLKRLEVDAPTIYRLVKIKIHRFFGIVFVVFSFLCLSRTPLPAIKPFKLKDAPNQLWVNKSWYENIWPDSFFGSDRWKRPLRLLDFDNKKIQSNDEIKPFNKMFFSQFFFEKGFKDGKYHLYHNFPQSFSIVSQKINSVLKTLPKESQPKFFEEHSNENLINRWIEEKKNRQNQIKQNIKAKINQIEKGMVLEDIVEKKLSSIDNNKNKISKQLDPRLSTDIRGTKLFLKNKSFLFLTKEYLLKKNFLVPIEKKNLTTLYTKNKLKLFLSENLSPSATSAEEVPFIPWKNVVEESYEKNKNLHENSFNDVSRIEEKSDLDHLKSSMVWDGIFKKFSQSLFSKSKIDQNVEKFENEFRLSENTDGRKEEDHLKIAKIYKQMPLWNINFNKKELERLKAENNIFLKFFFQKNTPLADRQTFVRRVMPFFRRNEFPGTITSRRGKAVGWNTFQKKPHAPFFVNQLSLLKNFFDKRKKIQINQDVPTKSWQPTTKLFQFLRDYLLSLQAYIRKYLKLPLFITVKNIIRQIFFQPTEWEKDWTDLSKEMYVECDFYGKAVSMGVKLPNFFANEEPKQIKIINPFQFRFWTRSTSQKSSLQESEKYSFLNVWGRETKMPFGKIKKSPSFLQLLIERMKLLLQYKVLKNVALSPSENSIEVQNAIKDNKAQSKFKVEQKIEKESSKLNLTKIQENNLKKFTTNSIERKLINNLPQTKTLSNFQKKEKSIYTRPYTFKNFSILLQKQWFSFYRFLVKKERELLFLFKNLTFKIKKAFLRKKTQILKIVIKLFSNVSRFIRFWCYQGYEFINLLIFRVTKNQKQISLNVDSVNLTPSKDFSQAYIIHSIWEDRMMSKPHMTSLINLWNQNDPLKKNLETFLNEQGILGNEKAEDLTEDQWTMWLKYFRGYTPSLKLWALWSPNYWTQAVEEYWKKLPSSQLNGILNQELNKTEKTAGSENFVENPILDNFLELHVPLFQAAQKQKKLSKFDALFRNYTEVGNDGDVDSFSIWQTKTFDKKTDYLYDTLKKVKGKDKTLLMNPTNFSLLLEKRQNKARKNILQQDLIKEFPLIQREKKRIDFDLKLQSLQERSTFFPVSIRRWKLKKLKNKLEKLAKTVIKKPQGGELSSSFGIGEKNKKMIRELFQSENQLFADILENWNSKILDDELLMYTTVSSFLRFANKNLSTSLFNNSDLSLLSLHQKSNVFDLDFILLEDIYLPTHLREIGILDCFDFQKNNQKIEDRQKIYHSNPNDQKESLNKIEKNVYTETISKWRLMLEQKQNLMKDRQTIVRFLWPTHRLEDLGCINRFWMGTANQSRFSMLRLHSFTNV